MSLFLTKISKVFGDQPPIKQNDHYIDHSFRFNKLDTKEQYKYNCFISTKDFNKTYELFKDSFIYIWTYEWQQKKYASHSKFKINDADGIKAYKVYKENGGTKSINYWKTNWKTILENNEDGLNKDKKLKLDEKIFEELYLSQYKDERRIPEMLQLYDEIFEFKRISYSDKNYKIFENKINCSNIGQGALGTCYFLEALSVLSNYGQLLYQLFPKEEINKEGLYQICLYHEGQWQKVFIDDYFVFYKDKNKLNKFAFAQPVNDCLFSCFLEKAYAKILGSYADANGGHEYDALQALTGFDNLVIPNNAFDVDVYNMAYERIRQGNLLSCSIIGHAYSVLDIIKPEKNKNNFEFKVRNPWRNFMKGEEKFKINDEENKKGIFLVKRDDKEDQFKDYFKYRLVICQTLFGCTVFSFKLKNNTPNQIYFSFELFEKSKIYIGLYDKNYFGIFSKIEARYKDLNIPKEKYTELNLPNDGYQRIQMDDQVKQEIISKTTKINNYYNQDYNENRLYHYHELKKSKYLLSITFKDEIKNDLSDKVLKIILKGNIDIKYEGNLDEIYFDKNNDKYNYGVKTGELFDNYKKIIEIFEKEFGVTMHKEAFGFYVETIFTNEVQTIIRFDKKTNLQGIISHDLKKELYFLGHDHIKGKIIGQGKCLQYEGNKKIKTINAEIDQNQIICELFEPDKAENKLYLTIPNLYKFNENSRVKSFFHPHYLFYKVAKGDWICDFCERFFKKEENSDSFGCRVVNCNFNLCPECLFEENTSRNRNYLELKKSKAGEIKYSKKEISLKCVYHKHELKYKLYGFGIFYCFKCNKKINGDAFKCPQCINKYLCMDCIYQIDEEKNLLKMQLNNCLFKVIIDNYNEDIYGYFQEDINGNNNNIYLVIIESWEKLRKYLKNNYFEIL